MANKWLEECISKYRLLYSVSPLSLLTHAHTCKHTLAHTHRGGMPSGPQQQGTTAVTGEEEEEGVGGGEEGGRGMMGEEI